MTIIKSNYCSHCHKMPNVKDASCKNKITVLCSRISSHAHITGKTIKAHPLNTTLAIIAITATLVAGAVLLGLGLGGVVAGGGLIGIGLLAGGLDLLVLGSACFHRTRRRMEADEYKKAHSLDALAARLQPDQKVCLVVETTADHNGAFKFKGPHQFEKKLPVVHIKVSNIEEVAAAIDQVSSIAKIQVLWVSAHGFETSDKILLGHRQVLGLENADHLTESFNKLAEDAAIVLNSCLTGGTPTKNPEAGNIASAISKLAAGRTVFAPKTSICYENICIKVKNDIEMGIKVSRWAAFTTSSISINKLFPRCIKKHLERDVLRVYQDGVQQEKASFFVKVA